LTKHHTIKLTIFFGLEKYKMKFKDFRQYFSEARVDRYLLATGKGYEAVEAISFTSTLLLLSN